MTEQRFHTRTVNCYIYRGQTFQAEYLVLRKSPRARETQAGLWQVVAGKMDEGETLWQAALREMREETGLTPVRFFDIGVETFYNYRRDAICMHPSFAAEVAADAQVQLSEEHDAFEWLSYDQALVRLPYPNQREALTRLRFTIVDPVGPLPMEIPAELWRSC